MPLSSQTLRFQRQILLPVGCVLLALVVVFAAVFQWHQDRQESERTLRVAGQAGAAWQRLLHENLQHLGWFAREAAGNEELRQAMQQGNHAALLDASRQRFAELRKQFGISHWYFIRPDGRILLRVHAPQRSGDPIDRKTLNAAMRSGQPGGGLELGPLGTYALRYVLPWHDGDTLIGYIELAQEVEYFASAIGEMLEVEVITAVDKQATSEAAFAAGKLELGFSGFWNEHPRIAIQQQGSRRLPEKLADYWNTHPGGQAGEVLTSHGERRDWSASLLPLPDVEGEAVASMAILRDVGSERTEARRKLLSGLLLAGGLAVLLLLALATRTRRIEQRLLSAHQSLAANEQRFRDIFSTSSDWWFWETDADHRFTFMTDNLHTLLGIEVQQLIGKSRRDIMVTDAPEMQARIAAHFADLAAHRPFHRFEYEARLAGDKRVWLSFSGMRASFSKRLRFLGRHAQKTMTAKISTAHTVQIEVRISLTASRFMAAALLPQPVGRQVTEADQRAQHLEVRHQGIEFRDLGGLAVELADDGARVPLLQGSWIGIRVDLGLEVGSGVGNHLVRVRGTDRAQRLEMLGDVVELELAGGQERIGRHHAFRYDGTR